MIPAIELDNLSVLFSGRQILKVKTKEGKTAAMLAQDYPQIHAVFADKR